MHAYTLHPSIEFAVYHRITERKDRAKGKPPMNLPLVLTSTGILAFLREPTSKQSRLLKTLEIARQPQTRNWLAQTCHRGRVSIQQDIDVLIALGKLTVEEVRRKGRTITLYSLPNAHPLGIWKTACFTWRLCPSCGAKRKLRRLPSGDWLHWCDEHHSEVLSKEAVG